MPKYCIVANHAYFHTYENEWADSTTPSYVGDLFLGEVEANSPEEAIASVVCGNDYFYADYLTAYKVSKATKGKTPVYFGHIAQDGVIMLRHKDLSSRSGNHPYALIRDATEFIQAGSIPDPKKTRRIESLPRKSRAGSFCRYKKFMSSYTFKYERQITQPERSGGLLKHIAEVARTSKTRPED